MAAPMNTFCNKYLFHFAHEHIDFRIAELASILKLFHIETTIPQHSVENPFMILKLPSEKCVRKIASRAILVKSVYGLWAHGNSHAELNKELRQLPKEFLESHTRSKDTFKYNVTTFNKTLPLKEKLKKIVNLPEDVLDFDGKVDLKNAQHTYHIVEYYGRHGQVSSEEPEDVYFAKWIADGQREKINEFHLQKRHFIANTSMDAGLSMIMANIGQADRNMLVFDPFVGSGSLLVSAAVHGAYVMGTDIDYLLLHAKARPSRCDQKTRAADESIRSNLCQYGLENMYVDALVADASRPDMWRQQTLFDAIITDPPYGIREGAKKVGSNKEDVYIDEEIKAAGNHIPQRKDYHLSEVFKDLLNFSARYLHTHGRLVYWFPVSLNTYREENIPTHPCLQIVHNCEQRLNSKVARRLITMEKTKDYTDDMVEAVMQVDHFQDSTFREMYFTDSTFSKGKAKDSAKFPPNSEGGAAGDSTQSETMKSETAKSETMKSETTKSETVKSETAKSETAKSEALKSETTKSETTKLTADLTSIETNSVIRNDTSTTELDSVDKVKGHDSQAHQVKLTELSLNDPTVKPD